MRNLFGIIGLCAVLLLSTLIAVRAGAQSTTGSITGTVTDSTGAVIPHAVITATEVNKGITFHGRSNEVGEYLVLNVTPGDYKVEATAPGFATAEALNATLVIDQKLLVNFTLKAGAATTTGPREYGNSTPIDGVESTTNRTQDITVVPSVDSVQEFKVATGAYNAEFGSSAGAVVSIDTKAGTNNYHGDGYEFFRPNFTAARPYGFGAKEPPSILKQHNFGGTLGGPIVHNKAFFFGSYEGTRQTNAYTYLYSTPPVNQITFPGDGSADLSQMVDPFAGLYGAPAGLKINIFDPNVSYPCYGGCSKQFAGNIIPAGRVSQAGMNTLLNFYPKPDLPGIDNGWFDNFFA